MDSISLLPQSEDITLKSIDTVYAKKVDQLNDEIQVISTLAQPKMVDESFLPYLAHTYQVAFWSNELTTDEKRAIIDSSISLSRKKGTLFALKDVLKRLNIDIKLQEWFEYNGLPYHFKIDVDFISRPAGKEELRLIEEFIEIYKNEKSVLELISVKLKSDLNEKVASVAIVGENIEVMPFVTRNLSSTNQERVFASAIASERIEVKPYVVKDFIFINKQKQAMIIKTSEKITSKLIIGDI